MDECIKYRGDILECFENSKLDKKIDETDLEKIIKEEEIPLRYFLKSKYFSKKYSSLIKRLFLSDITNIEYVISNYVDGKSRYYFPKSINESEMHDLCCRYVDSQEPSLNYIRLIKNKIQELSEFEIDSRLVVKAKKKEEELERTYFDDSKTKLNGHRIAVYTDEKGFNTGEETFKTFINVGYIKNNSEPEDLLDYLMYIESLFNNNWILGLASFPNFESSTLQRMLGARTKKHYEISYVFHCKSLLMLLTVEMFQQILNIEQGKRIEDLIKYFFNEYSKQRFAVNWLPLEFADDNQKIDIQLTTIFPIEEKIRKQWKLFTEDKEIDRDLFEEEITPRIGNLRSLKQKKYIYLNEKNENIKKVQRLMFSEQSQLNFDNKHLNYNNFFDALRNVKMYRSYFEDYAQEDINFLVAQDIISNKANGYIYLTNKQARRLIILMYINDYGVVNYNYAYKKMDTFKSIKINQTEIDEMIAEEILVSEGTLFSRPEVDYLNYLLNDSQFDNALALRNKYGHGGVIEGTKEAYFYGLIILLVYVFKINEELRIDSLSDY